MPLDVGVGLLLSLFISHLFGVPTTAYLVVLCIAVALLPDIDLVTALWGRWRHRELTHYPLVYIPLVLVTNLLFGPVYATLLFLGVLAHLVHDTIGIGWGVSWFWPITDRRFLFLPEEGRRKRYGWFMTWLPKDQYTIIEEPPTQHWVIQYYLRPSVVGAIEYSFLLMSIFLFILMTR